MSSPANRVVFLTLLIAALGLAPATQPAAERLALGDAFPDLALKALGGADVSATQTRADGQLVVVMLRGWVGYQCPVCSRQVGELMAAAAKIDQAGARVLFIYPGPAKDVEAHAKAFMGNKEVPPSWVFAVDEDLKVVKQLGLFWDAPRETAYPATYVVAKDGKVSYLKVSKSHGGRAPASEILAALAK